MELVRGGHCYNLVFHLVKVGVGLHLDTAHNASTEVATPHRTYIILGGVFGIEVLVADESVVEVVECGHTEDALVEGTKSQLLVLKWLILSDYGRSPFVAVARRRTHIASVVVNEGVEQTRLHFEPLEVDRRRRRTEHRQSRWIGEIGQVGSKCI